MGIRPGSLIQLAQTYRAVHLAITGYDREKGIEALCEDLTASSRAGKLQQVIVIGDDQVIIAEADDYVEASAQPPQVQGAVPLIGSASDAPRKR